MEDKIAVKVDHVSMHFNMASEGINSFREYLTKLLKKQLFYKDFIAVNDVSFEVKKGEIFGIVGTNGSGKSTLLKMSGPTASKVSPWANLFRREQVASPSGVQDSTMAQTCHSRMYREFSVYCPGKP